MKCSSHLTFQVRGRLRPRGTTSRPHRGEIERTTSDVTSGKTVARGNIIGPHLEVTSTKIWDFGIPPLTHFGTDILILLL